MGRVQHENGVYASVIRYCGLDRGNKLLLIFEHTRALRPLSDERLEDEFRHLKQAMPDLRRDTFDDFLSANQEPRRLRDDLDLGAKYELITEEERERRHEQGPPYLSHDTSSLLMFSRVGFNAVMGQALVAFYQVEWLGCDGRYFFDGRYFVASWHEDAWACQQDLPIWGS